MTEQQTSPVLRLSHSDYRTAAWQYNAEISRMITALFMPDLFESLQGYSLVRNSSFLPVKRTNVTALHKTVVVVGVQRVGA